MGAFSQSLPATVSDFEAWAAGVEAAFELIDGRSVERALPTKKHRMIQRQLAELLRQRIGGGFEIFVELEFRPEPEHQLPVADVVVISKSRWEQVPDNGYLAGAPELVVEVLSLSNSALEMNRKRRLCLESGCVEFWLIDPDQRTIEVSKPGQIRREYSAADEISLDSFEGASLSVAAVFA